MSFSAISEINILAKNFELTVIIIIDCQLEMFVH